MPQVIKAVAFDMDGIIFDSEKLYFDSFILASKKYNVELPHNLIEQFSGKTTGTCKIMLQSYLNDSDLVEKVWNLWGIEAESMASTRGIPVKEGVIDLIDFLISKKIPIALVTSACRESVLRNFSHAREGLINEFSPIITLEKVENPKPHPEPYITAFNSMGISPKDAIVFEDSITGATASIEAGANTLMINKEDYVKPLKDRLFFTADNFKDTLGFVKTCSFIG